MGILNATPDSFSDGGRYLDPKKAVERGIRMIEEGADIIDIGGESTRPGSESASVEEELKRVIPVIEELRKRTNAVLSIDTTKAVVARKAVYAGASIINDISAHRFDPAMTATASETDAAVILMHMQGEPKTMQADPQYTDLIGEVKRFLTERVQTARSAGVSQIIVDPGIGFGKRVEHNLELLRSIPEFLDIGVPVMVGTSRKSFIGAILGLPVEDRLEGTLASTVAAVLGGARLVRVHDVKAVRRAVEICDAIRTGIYDAPPQTA